MKYLVTMPFACFVYVEVEADNEDEAIDSAYDEAHISGYCGNGGSNKLIGVSGENISIEAGETPLENGGFSIRAEKLE
jgi:hypothetical protein